MLSTVIEKIQTLFSKHVLLSSFYPVLIGVFVNAALLYLLVPRFRQWVASQEPKASVVTFIEGAVVLFAVAVAAFFLNTISLFLREAIEGQHWPLLLTRVTIPIQRERLERIEHDIDETKRLRRAMPSPGVVDPRLMQARLTGRSVRRNHCVYPHSLEELLRLRAKRLQGSVIRPEEIEKTIEALERVLQTNDADADVGSACLEHSRRLNGDHVDFDHLLSYADDRLDQKLIELEADKRLSFGDRSIAPTRVGNMVNALSAYTRARYNFDIALLWPRLQNVLPSGTYGSLQDAKAELDSLIALLWIGMATTAAWWLACIVLGAPWPFVAVAAGGPLVCTLLYLLVIASYAGFHALLRSAVDLHRFALLKALHLPLPNGPVEERAQWDALSIRTEFAEDVEMRYEHHGS